MQDKLISATADAHPTQQTIECPNVEALKGQLKRIGTTQVLTKRHQFAIDIRLCFRVVEPPVPEAVRLRDDVFAIIENELGLRKSPPEQGQIAFSNLLEAMDSDKRRRRGSAWLEALQPRAHRAPGYSIEALGRDLPFTSTGHAQEGVDLIMSAEGRPLLVVQRHKGVAQLIPLLAG